MLPDFIAANKLRAKILPCYAKGNLIKCELFFADKRIVLAVHFAKQRLSEEKVKKALGASSLHSVDASKAEEITGYGQHCMPPISIYGVTVLIDSKLLAAKKLHCIVAEEKTLEISCDEIKNANEETIVADITD